MLIDSNLVFGLPTITNSNTATISTNVYDAGSAIKVFGGPKVAELFYRVALTADASLSAKIDVVGSDVVGCNDTTNVVIASTGVMDHDKDGTLMSTSGTVQGALKINGQTVAKRYYAVILTLGGTNPDSTAGGIASVVLNGQTNMLNTRAAIPA